MKTVIQLILLLLTAATLAACNSNQPSADQPRKASHSGHDNPTAKITAAKTGGTSTGAVLRLKDDHLNAIYRYYIDLTESLAADDVSAAKVASAAIELGAGKINGGKALATSAADISGANDIAAQRDAYATLSDRFIALLKNTGVATGNLYVLHCPMARDDKGAFWLSNDKTIRNPYYGEHMLTCGAVMERLN